MSPTFRSLRNHNYRLYATGGVVSNTGTWMQRVAQDWLVLTMTDSPTAVGVVTAFQFAPTLLFGLHAGGLYGRAKHWGDDHYREIAMRLRASAAPRSTCARWWGRHSPP